MQHSGAYKGAISVLQQGSLNKVPFGAFVPIWLPMEIWLVSAGSAKAVKRVQTHASEFHVLSMWIPGAWSEHKVHSSKYDLLSGESSYPLLERHFCAFLTSNTEILLLASCGFTWLKLWSCFIRFVKGEKRFVFMFKIPLRKNPSNGAESIQLQKCND